MIQPLDMGRCVHRRNAAAVPRKKRGAHVQPALVQILGEVDKRLRRIAETMQEKNRPRVASAQIYRACTRNDVVY
jgi:hypothetical protein